MIVYMIAGPPGIGKSTHSKSMIPVGTPIVDHDLVSYQYKKEGFENYKDIASKRCNERVRKFLLNKEDFALELNLGFPSHYSYLNYISGFHHDNKVELILFFTDDVKLCLNRADIRYKSGGHEVEADVIKQMYANTISLFNENKRIFSTVRLIDVTYDSVKELTADANLLPKWVVDNGMGLYL
jgi:predicted ABC-type ATPase